MTAEYLTDDGPTQMDGGTGPYYLVVRRGANGDIYIGTRAAGDRTANTVRFRMANGGANDHRRLRAAVVELAAALEEVSNDKLRGAL